MRTFCPHCQTTFRITPEQLKARAGKVRCGQCQTVFNALDCLLDETSSTATVQPVPPAAPIAPTTTAATAVPEPSPPPVADTNPTLPPSPWLYEEARSTAEAFNAYGPIADTDKEAEPVAETSEATQASDADEANEVVDVPDKREPFFVETDPPPPIDDDREDDPFKFTQAFTSSDTASTQQPLRAIKDEDGLIMPRATNEIEGYSRWAEDPISAPISLPEERPTRWPFVLAALLLILVLAGQIAFHFRSEIVVSAPSLRPLLLLFSQTVGADLPLPRNVNLVSIEASDLQTDPSRNNLLMLTATLHNRARYAQAFPSLELSLTDTGDTAIVRRVFPPTEYLPPATAADQPFAAGSDINVRVWLEAKSVSAAGYRLYVFYP